MSTVPDVVNALADVLGSEADCLAQQTGFVRRQSRLSGARFAQTLVMSWLQQPSASLEQMARTAALLGADVSAQALDQRFSPQAAHLLQGVLEAAVGEVVASDPARIPLLQRFTSVQLQDATTIVLPDELAELYQGCGGSTPERTQAAMKLQVRYDLLCGQLHGPCLQDGRACDSSPATRAAFADALPAGGLRLADQGYFCIEEMVELDATGRFYLGRLKSTTAVYEVAEDGSAGRRRDVLDLLERTSKRTGADTVDLPVCIGEQARHRCRLLAERVPQTVAEQRRRKLREDACRRGRTPNQQSLRLASWTVLVSNAPPELLSVREAVTLASARWQIELLFKLWKRDGRIDEWRTRNPWRILCEVYAKLIAVLVQHWMTVMACWQRVDRSLFKAGQAVRQFAALLAAGLAGRVCLDSAVAALLAGMSGHGCRINRRRRRPNTYQRLLQPDRRTLD